MLKTSQRTVLRSTRRLIAFSHGQKLVVREFRSLTPALAVFSSSASDDSKREYVSTIAAVATSFLLCVGWDIFRDKKAEACGIMAFVGEEPAVNYLMEGLYILQNRGYDSAGVSTINSKGELVTTKFASQGTTSDCIDMLKQKAPSRHSGDKVGIAHTRWATHGGKTDQNAHPHSDCKDRVALVHNGTIENSGAIKKELISMGISFRSETDTEVIAQLIGVYLDTGLSMLDAVKKALTRLEGTWGLVIMDKDNPNQIIAARNGSPLVVGVDTNRMFVASEVSAFSRHTKAFIALKDKEVAVIRGDGGGTLDLARIEKAAHEDIELSPEPYKHWTMKEIMEQPAAVSRTLHYGGRFSEDGRRVKLGGLDEKKALLMDVQNLILSACGTSYFASLYGALIMRDLKAFDTVQVFDASEVVPDSFPSKGGGLCVLSQSGETKDTHRTLKLAEDLNIPTFSVVNKVGSLIARTTNCGVYLYAGHEHAVASTKAFTTQVTALGLIAGWFAQNRDTSGRLQTRMELFESIHRLPIYVGMALQTQPRVKEIAQKLKNKEHLFVLGKGYGEPIAREGALKIKEITYIHAEGYGGGALKHGPFALLDKGTPVILLIFDDEHAELMKTAAHEVRARGTYNIVITDKPSLVQDVADEVIRVPSNGPMTALLGVIPLQLLAYELSVARGIDPDKPKNLAKAVTVD